jgi:pyruvate dehydrogenase E1 component beta subunit
MVSMALKAAGKLGEEGIDAEVLDPRTLVPLDEEALLDSVQKTGRAVVVHEAWERCGTGAEIAAVLADKAFDHLKAPVKRVAAENVPIPFSPVLEDFVLPDEEDIVRAVTSIM